MKYLLEADDREMAMWREAAKAAGVSFADWLRQAAREALQPKASSVSVAITESTIPAEVVVPSPPRPNLDPQAARHLQALPGGKVFKGPDPKPTSKGKPSRH